MRREFHLMLRGNCCYIYYICWVICLTWWPFFDNSSGEKLIFPDQSTTARILYFNSEKWTLLKQQVTWGNTVLCQAVRWRLHCSDIAAETSESSMPSPMCRLPRCFLLPKEHYISLNVHVRLTGFVRLRVGIGEELEASDMQRNN